MKTRRTLIFLALALTCLFCSIRSYAQFPTSISLDAKSAEVKTTSATKPGVKYRITVTGTYSQWPQQNGYGVDAAYVYNVPQEEVNALRWPPEEITIPLVGTKVKVVEIPHWVGDPTDYPPQNLIQYIPGLQVKINFRGYLGFRVNGLPIDPAPVFDSVTHRYQIEMVGDGKPFSFQILDSTFSVIQERVIGRYEDNSGTLKITVEEIVGNDLNICSLDPILDANKKIIGVKLQASILQLDSNATAGKRNILTDAGQVAIFENGKFICPDSIRCGDRSQPIAAGLVVDRSGSMLGEISPDDKTQRMSASKQACNKFISKMQPKDEAMIITFSDDVTVAQTWTSDTTLLKSAINAINPDGFTAFNQALINALDSVKIHPNPRRVVIALTDGVNNRLAASNAVFAKLREVKTGNLPVYVIALGLDRTSPFDIAGLDTLKMIADSSKGKLYEVNKSAALDSIYLQLNKDIAEDECCTIYFNVTPCKDSTDSVRTITIFYPVGDSVVRKTVQYRTDCSKKILGINDDRNGRGLQYQAPFNVTHPVPNPNSGHTQINYDLPTRGNVTVSIVDALGSNVATILQEMQSSGTHSTAIQLENITPGVYHVLVSLDGVTVTRKLIIIK